MGPTEAIGVVERANAAVGSDALSAMRFLAVCGWCFAGLMAATALWAIRGRFAALERTLELAGDFNETARGVTAVLGALSTKRRRPRTNPGSPKGEDS